MSAGRTLLVPLLLALAGCSSFDLVNGITGSGHYVRHPDLVYRDGPRGGLDVYTPAGPANPAPVIVFFYGGGWREGAREDYRFVASELTRAGYVVAIPDYRLHPEVAFPVFVEDGAAAVAWVAGNIAQYGGDASRIVVAGHSAGAHIAALLALDRRYLDAEGIAPDAIGALVGLSGPYDFLPLGDGYLQQVFPEPLRERSQPVNFVRADAPSSLLVHGGDDDTVDVGNSRRLATALSDAGVSVELEIYEGVGHARVVAALASPLDRLAPTARDIAAFLDAVPALSAAQARGSRQPRAARTGNPAAAR